MATIVSMGIIKVLDKSINQWSRIRRCHLGSLLTGEKQKRWVVETLAVGSTVQAGFRCILVSGHPAGGVGTDSLSLA